MHLYIIDAFNKIREYIGIQKGQECFVHVYIMRVQKIMLNAAIVKLHKWQM